MRPLLMLLLGLAFVGAIPVAAQTTTAELSGSVTDPSGAAISKVKVTATNTGTGLTHQAVTDDAGAYVATQLPPGAYNLSAEAAGFRKTVEKNVTLEVSRRAKLDFSLHLGQLIRTVAPPPPSHTAVV